MGLFWLMPVIQPLLCMLLAALAAFSVAYAGVAALHFQPYVAPLLVWILTPLNKAFSSCHTQQMQSSGLATRTQMEGSA